MIGIHAADVQLLYKSKISEEDLIRLENKAAGIKGDEGSRNKRSSSLDNVEEIKLDDKPVLTKKRNEKKIKKRRAKRREAYLAKMNAMDRYVQLAELLLFMLTRQQSCDIFY